MGTNYTIEDQDVTIYAERAALWRPALVELTRQAVGPRNSRHVRPEDGYHSVLSGWWGLDEYLDGDGTITEFRPSGSLKMWHEDDFWGLVGQYANEPGYAYLVIEDNTQVLYHWAPGRATVKEYGYVVFEGHKVVMVGPRIRTIGGATVPVVAGNLNHLYGTP